MKLIETNEHDLIFGMSAGQKTTLERVLREYPVLPEKQSAISRTRSSLSSGSRKLLS